ncbi:MAG: hypothetical protein M1816_001999 [Peltula sp. TS41687]|nr:MAG: hypothetical protein M1816_001999 [Peltula sp. TS41687]
MKANVHPKRIGAHRVACFALYRALLVQSHQVPLPPDRLQALRQVVRDTFRRNKEVQSKRWLTHGFNAGYEALELLRSSSAVTSDEQTSSSTTRILELLDKASAVTQPRASHDAPTRPPRATKPPRTEPFPGATPALARPHLQISGRRHVPVLANANSFPFLRFKKPQSPFLSRVLRDKIMQKTKRFTLLLELEDAVDEARAEDVWDREIAKTTAEGRVKSGSSRKRQRQQQQQQQQWTTAEPGWTPAVEGVVAHVKQQIKESEAKKTALATRMYEIVERERELARKEKAERRLRRVEARRVEGEKVDG